ncbi:unnamed protein product [Lactuca saligna]|uniref:Thioredoxin domain-containing protein n=1 Tax=Lactuca saligna TaxID=75948 RepID=A0AA35VYI1_LACSI|nr:unnamed protein product [Lactuca saligna]
MSLYIFFKERASLFSSKRENEIRKNFEPRFFSYIRIDLFSNIYLISFVSAPRPPPLPPTHIDSLSLHNVARAFFDRRLWWGHCKKLAPEWKKAAKNLQGKVKLGHVNYDDEKIKRVQSFALVQLETNVAPPEVIKLTSSDVMEEKCGSAAICFVSFLPDILDSKAEGRNKYIEILLSVVEKFKRSPYKKHFRLLPFGVQPKLTYDEMKILRRLERPLPCHFALDFDNVKEEFMHTNNMQNTPLELNWRYVELARRIEKTGVSAIVVHGRLRALIVGSIGEFLSAALLPPEPLAVQNVVDFSKMIGALDVNENLTHLDAQLLETKSGISNRLSHNQSSVSAIICSGLFPGIASVVHRETSMSFKTIDDVQVLLYAFFSYVGGGEVQD